MYAAMELLEGETLRDRIRAGHGVVHEWQSIPAESRRRGKLENASAGDRRMLVTDWSRDGGLGMTDDPTDD